MSVSTGRRSSEHSEAESLRAYMDDSDCIIDRTIRRYTQFMRQCYSGSVNKLFKRVGVDQGMYLYEEKTETSSSSSFVQEICPGARKYSCSSDRPRRRSQVHGRLTQMSAFGGGEITGTLDDVMAGVYADTPTAHGVNCAVQFGLEKVLDSGIMETFERADDAHPFRYLGVKWLEVESTGDSRDADEGVDDDDDDDELDDEDVLPTIIDELYWIERTGIHTTRSGRKFGYQLIKTVDSDYATNDRMYRSIQRSVCYLYHQVDVDVVHVFTRGIIEIPHSANMDVDRVIKQASGMMLAPTRARQCHRMKMIAQMIERSKNARSELLVCRCSKVVQGLPRVDLCSDCRVVMQQCKLLSTHDAALRKRQLIEKARSSFASTSSSISSTASTASSIPLLPLASQHGSIPLLPLANQRGSVRRDGETREETDPDVLSYRMLLPIREERPTSAYREHKKQSGNVLTKMLLKHENRRREIASDFIPPSEI